MLLYAAICDAATGHPFITADNARDSAVGVEALRVAQQRRNRGSGGGSFQGRTIASTDSPAHIGMRTFSLVLGRHVFVVAAEHSLSSGSAGVGVAAISFLTDVACRWELATNEDGLPPAFPPDGPMKLSTAIDGNMLLHRLVHFSTAMSVDISAQLLEETSTGVSSAAGAKSDNHHQQPQQPLQAEVTGMFVLYANMLASLKGSQVRTSLLAIL